MGKSTTFLLHLHHQSPKTLHQFARFITTKTSNRSNRRNQLKPVTKSQQLPNSQTPKLSNRRPLPNMEVASSSSSGDNSEHRRRRMPLSEVVSDCVKRWFQDTLKEAKSGDTSMQVLVGQMYHSGYGVDKDAQMGKAWINRASKVRSSALKVGDKRPGYNVSDSDSEDDMKEDEAK